MFVSHFLGDESQAKLKDVTAAVSANINSDAIKFQLYRRAAMRICTT